MAKIADMVEKMGETVVEGYRKIKDGVIGVAGMVPVALAYPVYQRILKKERQRVAPEILWLSDELMQ